MMPKMDGIETTKRLRKMGYTSPVVALTANAIAGQAEMFLNHGFDDFISKPIDIRQLNASLNRLIRDKQPSEVIEAAHKEKAEMEEKLVSGSAYQQIDPDLAVIFTRDAEKAIKVLEKCMKKNLGSENDIQMYIINVHAMKSALANIGATELSATALRLEQAGRGKDINVMITETGEFIEELHKVIEEIKPKDEDGEDIEDTEAALALFSEKLEIIREACKTLDKKTAKNALNQLKEKTWSRKTKETLDTIAEHLLHSEFDDVVSIVDNGR